jgi:hypothetical protein
VITDSSENRTVGFTDRANDDLATDLTEDLRARVKSELEPGERLLWSSRSVPPPAAIGARYFIFGTIALVLFALGLVAIAYTLGGPRPVFANRESTIPLGLFLCGVGGVMFALTVAVGWGSRVELRRKANVCYAITDRRAIVWLPEPQPDAVRVISLRRGRIKSVERVERGDGSGNLEFSWPRIHHSHWRLSGFEHIPEVRRVEQIVRNNLMQDEGREG